MKSKTYRIDIELADQVQQMTINYIKKHGEIMTETKTINDLLRYALKDLKDKNIEELEADNID